ncbi:MAG TPA: SDR family NAD(P)-dependent oxidoreductase [Steroidobacteraceae bacterium]|jgi:short-subunit dehydrogenase|nr:SDR family NAD(P)-dependent oxidoreductase [Steroidobacteraceae bacterium]
MSAQIPPGLNAERMRAKYGPWAVIAGASEGTGAEYARQLAAQGLHCLLVARRTEPLRQIAQELIDKYHVQTRVLSVDLSSPDAAQRMKTATADVEVGLYVSNAGADSTGLHFLDVPPEQSHRLINMNVRTVIDAVYAFAPPMKARGRGGILLMSSGAALGGQPRVAMYSGTKAFELNFGESLWVELRKFGVDVLSVAAPAMDTPVLRAALAARNLKAQGIYDPKDVVRIALEYLPIGPTYVFPLGPHENADTLNEARRSRLLAVAEITKGFFGSD